MTRFCCRHLALAALLAAPQAWAQAVPVFTPGGPDAGAYGAAEGYPLPPTGRRSNEQHLLIGLHSHYDRLFPAHEVARGPAASNLARAPHELELAYTYRGERHDLGDYLARHPTTGLLVLHGGTILFEHYQYGRTEQDRFLSQSMAKTVNAMLVGIALGEGAIRSVDDPVETYAPELAGSEIGRTPIRALLHMASGIAFTETYDGHDDSARLFRLLFAPNGPGTAGALRQFDTREAPPDTIWHYAGLNSEALGLVLARATGMPLAAYLSTRIWSRIGAEANAAWTVDASGLETGACCLSATLRDWGRLGLLLAQDGAWEGQQVVPRQWVLDATTPPAPDSFLAPRRMTRFYGYGYQVWLLPGPRRQFALLGIHGQAILVDPESRLVLVHTAARLKPSADPGALELRPLWNALVAQEGR